MKSVSQSCAPRAAYAGDYDPFKRAFRKNLSAEQLASFMREKLDRTERDIFSSAFYRFCFPLLFYGRDTAGACFTFVQLLFTVSC